MKKTNADEIKKNTQWWNFHRGKYLKYYGNFENHINEGDRKLCKKCLHHVHQDITWKMWKSLLEMVHRGKKDCLLRALLGETSEEN